MCYDTHDEPLNGWRIVFVLYENLNPDICMGECRGVFQLLEKDGEYKFFTAKNLIHSRDDKLVFRTASVPKVWEDAINNQKCERKR